MHGGIMVCVKRLKPSVMKNYGKKKVPHKKNASTKLHGFPYTSYLNCNTNLLSQIFESTKWPTEIVRKVTEKSCNFVVYF